MYHVTITITQATKDVAVTVTSFRNEVPHSNTNNVALICNKRTSKTSILGSFVHIFVCTQR